MAWVKNEKDIVTLCCPFCKQLVCFEYRDMRHYRHDVDGNNVYVTCPGCSRDINFYKHAIERGWVEASD
jgi:hypothetical protein